MQTFVFPNGEEYCLPDNYRGDYHAKRIGYDFIEEDMKRYNRKIPDKWCHRKYNRYLIRNPEIIEIDGKIHPIIAIYLKSRRKEGVSHLPVNWLGDNPEVFSHESIIEYRLQRGVFYLYIQVNHSSETDNSLLKCIRADRSEINKKVFKLATKCHHDPGRLELVFYSDFGLCETFYFNEAFDFTTIVTQVTITDNMFKS